MILYYTSSALHNHLKYDDRQHSNQDNVPLSTFCFALCDVVVCRHDLVELFVAKKPRGVNKNEELLESTNVDVSFEQNQSTADCCGAAPRSQECF